jgi:hypothetical protein
LTKMVALGAVYQPDEIKLMRSILDEAEFILAKAERTSAMKVKLASRILAAAAKGERDPNKLRIAALVEEADLSRPDALPRQLRDCQGDPGMSRSHHRQTLRELITS